MKEKKPTFHDPKLEAFYEAQNTPEARQRDADRRAVERRTYPMWFLKQFGAIFAMFAVLFGLMAAFCISKGIWTITGWEAAGFYVLLVAVFYIGIGPRR